MKDQIQQIVHLIPFVGLAMQDSSVPSHQPIITRLVEAAIIGGVVMYGTVQALDSRIKSLEGQISDVKEDVRIMRADIYKPSLEK